MISNRKEKQLKALIPKSVPVYKIARLGSKKGYMSKKAKRWMDMAETRLNNTMKTKAYQDEMQRCYIEMALRGSSAFNFEKAMGI